MKAKKIVKWGILLLVVFGSMALLAVLIDERLSRRVDTWARDFGKKP